MKELVVATRNKKKLIEIQRLIQDLGVKPRSLDCFKGLPEEIEEDGDSFEANASKKALEISKRIDNLVIADDSGLEVFALNNEPGIHSARYAGLEQNDEKNIEKLLKVMAPYKGDERAAQFRCVICVSKGEEVIDIVEGVVRGHITERCSGNTGFGYDPVFIPVGYDKTFAQLGDDIKDNISHRAMALNKAKEVIRKYFE
ncbi:MAG: RdgB/HAM1 family non-canonical purine NTP pyrophosphatase [Candidatus Omnitrophota bacterium]